MTEAEKNPNRLILKISLSGHEELHDYQKGIRGLLRCIDVTNCDPDLRENIKAVYQLLSHLQPEHVLVHNNNSLPHNLDSGNA